MGSVYRESDRHTEALECFEEGAVRLHPLFEKLPQAYSSLLGALLDDALASLKELGQEPSEKLGRVMQSYARLSEGLKDETDAGEPPTS